jgi:hypothetical protein
MELRDQAPMTSDLTDYDRANLVLYLRILDAESDGASWQEAVKVLLGMDPEVQPERAWTSYQSHLQRAKWLSREGYRQLLLHG